MKRLVLAVLSLLSYGTAYALPLGNPSEASLLTGGIFYEALGYDFRQYGANACDAFSFRIGFYGDYVFNRHLEVNSSKSGYDIEDTEVFTNAAYLAINIWELVDFFATVGGTTFCIEANARSFNGPSGIPIEIETETGFSWSFGARTTLFESGCTSFGLEAQYLYTKPDVTRVTLAKSSSIYPDNSVQLKYHEWQVGCGVSHRVWNLVPYFGAKFSCAKVNFGNAFINFTPNSTVPITATLFDLDTRFNGGFVLGVSLVDCEKMALTVEARYPDEKAIHVNGQMRF